jgi:hypothetical protein
LRGVWYKKYRDYYERILFTEETAVSSALGVEGAIYYSYLLRLWQVPTSDEHTWRIQLENVRTGEKQWFASLEELLAFLSRETAEIKEISG